MKRTVGLLLALALSAPSFAHADVAPEPCDGKGEGDACETESGKSGTCNENGACEVGADDGCSASSGSMRGAAPGLAFVAGAALLFVVARRRGKSG